MRGNLPSPLQPDTTPEPPPPDSEEYWQQCRDAGNEARRKAGLPELEQLSNQHTLLPTQFQPTLFELVVARQAIKDQELQQEVLRAIIRLAENIPSSQNGKHERKKSTPGPDADPATIEGARLYGLGKPWTTIKRLCCPLLSGFAKMDDDQQQDAPLKLRNTIKQYVRRHKIHRPKKKNR